ncbi:CCQ_1a_G0006410.mRNA.1.CDS.1 [Saccharomyces cerevisiae]|nr:CCQ_1a_G0006410.mRNA.1.CDS.1 [Saccharomyces cerevisiae]CAI7173337.1 CCQ_1a_G0006410.mRNA.1.CDS.1 [Saccharomyces cerevisiae]
MSNGEGLLLFALRNKKTFIAVENRVGFLFYRYEILRDGDVPEGSDYKVKGKCGGFTLFKVLFCTATQPVTRFPMRLSSTLGKRRNSEKLHLLDALELYQYML